MSGGCEGEGPYAEQLQTVEWWHLFVGGPLDGQHLMLHGRPKRYEHRSYLGARGITDEYVLEPVVTDGSVTMYLYRHTSLQMYEVVMRLMAAYVQMRSGNCWVSPADRGGLVR